MRNVVFLLVAAACAFGAHVTHPPNPGGQPVLNDDGTKEYRFLVKPELEDEELVEFIKDFHLTCKVGTKKKKMKGERGGGGSGWTNSGSGGGHNWGGSSILPKEGATFTLKLGKNEEYTDEFVQWKVTADGDLNPDDPTDWGPGFDRKGNPDAAIHGPIVKADITIPQFIPPGVCTIAVDTSEPNSAYVVFATSADPADGEVPDPFVDYQGFEGWCEQHPAPEGLVFAGMSGVTDGSGDTNAARVTVPAGMLGARFFVIVVVDSGGDKCSGPSYEVTIAQ